MKPLQTLGLLLLGLLPSLYLSAQSSGVEGKGKHPQNFQIGLIISDVFYPKLAGEASFYIDDKHSLGGYAAFHGERYEKVYDDIVDNYSLGIFHRIFFHKPNELSMFSFKYGARYTSANLTYTKADWFPYTENGNEFLVFDEREFSENPVSMSYQLSVSYQEVSKPFFLEYYIGVNYHTLLNKNELNQDHEVQRNQLFVDSQWLREGFSPILGIIVGLGY